jgi:hypothetical protein
MADIDHTSSTMSSFVPPLPITNSLLLDIELHRHGHSSRLPELWRHFLWLPHQRRILGVRLSLLLNFPNLT